MTGLITTHQLLLYQVTSSIIFIDIIGRPPVWRARVQLPIKLMADRGISVIDHNLHRHPSCPLEPLFRALYKMDPEYDPCDVDLVTDRNNLRKLLTAVTGSGDREGNFRINVQLIGKTMLFTRWSVSAIQQIDRFKGFGQDFLKKFTTPFVNKSLCHQRIVELSWGGLKVVERYSVDAFIPDGTSLTDLTESMKRVTVNRQVNAPSSTIRINNGGTLVPQSTILEAKSRSVKREVEMTRVYPQLFFSQVHNLSIGFHQHGNIEQPIKQRNVRRDISLKKWEQATRSQLQMVIALITHVRKVLQEAKQSQGVVMFDGNHFKVCGFSPLDTDDKGLGVELPSDLVMKWGNVGKSVK
jgi:hypothetical protein